MIAMKVDARSFTRALDAALRAVSTDSVADVVLRCVLFEASEDTLRIVSTDKKRLAVSDLDSEGVVGAATALVEGGALRDFEPGGEGAIDIELDDGAVRISIGDRAHTFDTVAGTYPNYQVFLASDPAPHPIVVDRTALLSAIEDQPDDEPLLVRTTPGAIELGQLVPTRVEADYDGAAIALHIDAVLLHDAVESAAGPRVVIEATDPLGPVTIRSATPDTFTGVVMPLQVGRARPR